MGRQSSRSARRQQTSQEIRDTILEFIGRHFYGGDRVALAKDTPRLLKWVILKPAEWLDERGMTIASDSYRDLFLDTKSGVLMEAIRHGEISGIKYRPAYLGKVVESFLRIRGDSFYEKAKADQARQSAVMVDQVVAALGGRVATAQADPVRQLAQAATLLRRATRAQTHRKPAAGSQLDLF
ncbi:MAG: hypothetical protein JNL10_12670 [Verrucomicrobiales bacterium]|nr:hypothetical protein [Verrucomicrobiales bacterium]